MHHGGSIACRNSLFKSTHTQHPREQEDCMLPFSRSLVMQVNAINSHLGRSHCSAGRKRSPQRKTYWVVSNWHISHDKASVLVHEWALVPGSGMLHCFDLCLSFPITVVFPLQTANLNSVFLLRPTAAPRGLPAALVRFFFCMCVCMYACMYVCIYIFICQLDTQATIILGTSVEKVPPLDWSRGNSTGHF